MDTGETRVDGGAVHLDDVLTLGAVGLDDRLLHIGDRLVDGDDVRELEKRRLKHGVRAPRAETDRLGELHGVAGVKLHVVFRDIALDAGGQLGLKLLVRPRAVEQEIAAGLHVLHHLEALEIRRIVAGDKVRLLDVIRGADRLVAEAEVGDGRAAGFLGVVLEVSLHLFVGVVADDLDGVLVCADGAVRAETPEFARLRARGGDVGIFRHREREAGHVVRDGERELDLRVLGEEVFKRGEQVAGLGVLAAETVAAVADYAADELRAAQGGGEVDIERLAESAGLLRAVEHGEALRGLRQHAQQVLRGKRTVEVDLHDADAASARVQIVHDLLRRLADGAHRDEDVLRVRRAVIVEGLVVRADLGVDAVHVLLHEVRRLQISAVAGFAVLEEGLRLLRRAHQVGVVRVQRAGAEGAHGGEVGHAEQRVVVPDADLLILVARAEAVEEVEHRETPGDGGKVGDGGEVHDLLHAVGRQNGEARLAHAHHVAVVAENAERVSREGAGGDVEHRGRLLRRELIHVRDHQQQTLRRRERAGVCAGGNGAVDRAGGAALGLHFHDGNALAEDVSSALRAPLVHALRHRGGRSDRIDDRRLGKGVGNMGGGSVAVHRLARSVVQLVRAHKRELLLS